MPGMDSSSRRVVRLRWHKPASVLLLVGVLAFVVWTLPNWAAFWGNVSHFPSLWQIPANRPILINLTIKVASPLLVMGMTGMILWMVSLLTFSSSEDETTRGSSESVLRERSAERRSTDRPSFSRPEPSPKVGISLTPPLPAGSAPQPGHAQKSLSPTRSEPLVSTSSVEQAKAPTNEEQASPLAVQQSVIPPAAPVAETPRRSEPLVFGREAFAPPEPLLSVRLLKDVSMQINIPGGGHVVVPLTLNAKRVQLLAYIAWRRGELIDRDKILEQVFGWGLSDEEATEDKLSERFESHKKLLRKKIRAVIVEHINTPAGRQVIDPDQVDPFVSDAGFWGLSDLCRVEDLEAVEKSHKVLALARKDGKLVDEIPQEVRDACERLIVAYTGDFLEALLKKYPSEFRAWQGRSSWARKPYTLYRDYYLDALWSTAEYEWHVGQRDSEGKRTLGEAAQRKQQEHFGRAAQKYQSYAMYACNSRFDAKASFGPHGEYGERVGMSERCGAVWSCWELSAEPISSIRSGAPPTTAGSPVQRRRPMSRPPNSKPAPTASPLRLPR